MIRAILKGNIGAVRMDIVRYEVRPLYDMGLNNSVFATSYSSATGKKIYPIIGYNFVLFGEGGLEKSIHFENVEGVNELLNDLYRAEQDALVASRISKEDFESYICEDILNDGKHEQCQKYILPIIMIKDGYFDFERGY